MLLELMYELKENIDRHGLRWGVIFTLYAVFRKERRNYRLDRRDEAHNGYFAAVLANQRLIMDKLGVGEEWNAGTLEVSGHSNRTIRRYLQSWSIKPSTVPTADKTTRLSMRRKIKMNWQSINWITLLPALVGAIKLILQPFGIDLSHITDQQVNDVANGIAALLTIIGVFMSHTKGGATIGNPQSAAAIENNK